MGTRCSCIHYSVHYSIHSPTYILVAYMCMLWSSGCAIGFGLGNDPTRITKRPGTGLVQDALVLQSRAAPSAWGTRIIGQFAFDGAREAFDAASLETKWCPLG